MDTELLEKWDTYKPEKHGLFNTMSVTDAYQYVDDIVQTLPESDRITAYTAAYVMYNSVIGYYETNMICTIKEEK
jgi:hypothetical protein